MCCFLSRVDNSYIGFLILVEFDKFKIRGLEKFGTKKIEMKTSGGKFEGGKKIGGGKIGGLSDNK